MLRPRVIPALLLRNRGLVKTIGFGDGKYVGDPINTVRIFNEKGVDELVFLDIDATRRGSAPDFKLIGRLAAECRMPLCYGGGVTDAREARQIIGLGVEKVALSTAALRRPEVVSEIAQEVGSQSVVVVLDVRRRLREQSWEVWSKNATERCRFSPIEFAREFEARGAGEVVLNSIDRDGMMRGYDLDLAERVRAATTLPMTILGGAGALEHLEAAVARLGVVGLAAGSLFVFNGPYKAVLLSYPTESQRAQIDALAWAQPEARLDAAGGT